ncbi:hypothetical protein [Martelella sp. FOR1707]
MKRKTTEEKVGQFIVGMIGSISLFSGIAILVYQGYRFLRDGVFPSVKLLDALKFASDAPWLYAPRSWLGLHEIASALPLSVCLLAFGIFVLASAVD